MKLGELILCNEKRMADLEITGITCNSKDVKNGYVFVCINGTAVDGHKYAPDAVEMGASAIICERDLGLPNQIIVDNSRLAYSDICANWFGNPANSLKLIGVTGTNGKTSTTYMLKKILEKAGHTVGLIGTIQNMIGDEVVASKNTTPNAYELNSLFALMKAKGCTYVIMEVSSHALDQYRVYNLVFEEAVFTNLTQDHLDYHINMENYLEAKKKLFKMTKKAVINIDDKYGTQISDGLNCEVITYSTGNDSDYCAKAIKYKPASVEYELVSRGKIKHIRVNSGGKFTVYNSLSAAICALEEGVDIDVVANALDELKGVKGRAEVVPTGKDFTIIIDYAHTPDGLKNILKTFKECEKNRLIVLFGCGGDRDKTKRPIMGSIAVRNADYVIVTSDNPRSEDPNDIINDILDGMKDTKTPYKVIPNRVDAIRFAIENALKDDIIVLAGKGHETYQILSTGTIHLDEREVIAEVLKEK